MIGKMIYQNLRDKKLQLTLVLISKCKSLNATPRKTICSLGQGSMNCTNLYYTFLLNFGLHLIWLIVNVVLCHINHLSWSYNSLVSTRTYDLYKLKLCWNRFMDVSYSECPGLNTYQREMVAIILTQNHFITVDKLYMI